MTRRRVHPQPGQPAARPLDVANGIPVDLWSPSTSPARQPRGVRIPPHDKHSARRAAGLEAAIIDHSPMSVESLDDDGRSAVINVAGPAALLVAKLHKLGERVDTPDRLNDKDAHDIYRLLVATADPRSRRDHRSSFTLTRSPKRPRHRRWATWSNSSQAQMPSAPRWPVAPRKESASRHRFGFGQLPRAGPAVSLGVIGDGAPRF